MDVIAQLTGLHADDHATDAKESKEIKESDDIEAGPQVTFRALVTTKEAGAIIGKGGQNVAEVREKTGVKAGVSKVVPGVHERILSVSGPLDQVSKAYALFAGFLLDNMNQSGDIQQDQATIRILISHLLMGAVIGKAGAKIKEIQEQSGARMVASKDMLPQSTERVVDIQGGQESIQTAVYHLGNAIMAEQDRSQGTILYIPSAAPSPPAGRYDQLRYGTGIPSRDMQSARPNGRAFEPRRSIPTGPETPTTMSVPADLVGCIIGRGGSRINEIRQASGSRISIAKEPLDGDDTVRLFTIIGTPEANAKAMELLYEAMEAEKQRRMRAESLE